MEREHTAAMVDTTLSTERRETADCGGAGRLICFKPSPLTQEHMSRFRAGQHFFALLQWIILSRTPTDLITVVGYGPTPWMNTS